VAVLIGSLYVLAHLSSNSEYTVLRASGLSPGRAGIALAKVGLVFVVLTFATGEWISPFAEEMAQQVRMRAMQSLIGGAFCSGLWFKDERSFINVREARESNVLAGVRIYEFDSNYHLRQVTEAKQADFVGAGRWKLLEVAQTQLTERGPVTAHYPEAEWRSSVSPDLLNVLIVVPERMSPWKLYRYLQHLSDNRQKTERYEIALWKKLFYPLATLVMMALALPFAYMHARSGMVGVKVFLGIMLGIFFHMLNSLFSHIGLLKDWPPFAAAAVPSFLFLGTAVLMMVWIETPAPGLGQAAGLAWHEQRAGQAIVQELAIAIHQGPQHADRQRHEKERVHESLQRHARRHAAVAVSCHEADAPGLHGELLAAS